MSSVTHSDLASEFTFPAADLIPKSETEAAAFIRANPDFDGSGVVVAIIDTGVDPMAKGLQTTADGRRKILDCVDTTGSGDVDTSTKVSPDSEGMITGLTGRRLKIPSDWNNPSNVYGIGVKNILDLYYPSTKRRVLEKRKKRLWEGQNDTALASIRKRLLEIEHLEKKSESSSTTADSKDSESSEDKSSDACFTSKLGTKKKDQEKLRLEKEDLNSQLKLLEGLEKKIPDQGAVFDVITWNDGTGTPGAFCDALETKRSGWCVCVDNSFSGDLESCKVLRPYKEEYDIGRISQECMCNFTVNVYGEKGDTTVICATSSSHGTHVAAITAAYRPDNTDLNGVAPGAQIVSIKIGDSRLSAMETGTALMRAMEYCNRNKIDIANYSFGEPAAFQNAGRIMEAIERSIHKYNLCFVTSHGNAGPGLRTGGAPAASLNGAFTVTAYLSPAMRKAQYALDNPNCASQHYYWSSRGPCMDGGLGVTVCAPGGAITSVAQTLMKGEELMNGTSMSSPNAAGNIALILSGLKQIGLDYTPSSIERTLKNTALKMPDHCSFSSGAGVVQSLKSFNHFKEFAPKMDNLNHMYLKTTTAKGQKNGILLHNKSDFDKSVSRHYVTVDVKFSPRVDSETKCDFSVALALAASESWVTVPSCVYMTNNTRGFYATVDTSYLKPGAHYAEIMAYDEKNFDYGPLFRFPVTVLKPLNETSSDTEFCFDSIQLSSGKIIRKFLRPPQGASFVTIKFTSLSSEAAAKLNLHMVQIKECSMHTEWSHHKQFVLESESSTSYSFHVVPNVLLELCLAQLNSWSVNSFVKMVVSFQGVIPSCDNFTTDHFAPPLRIDLENRLSRCTVEPNAVLNHLITPLRPTDYKIVPLDSERDCNSLGPMVDGRYLCQPISEETSEQDASSCDLKELMYALELTYLYSHSGKEKDVYPECPLLGSMLYESQYDSQMWIMFDSNKQVMGYGDFKADKYSCSLTKGDYTIKMWIRHPKYEVLDKLQALQFIISRKQPNINLSFYTTHALVSERTFKSTSLAKGEMTHMFVSPIAEDKLPKQYTSGSYLSGKISFIGNEPGKSCSSYPLKYQLGPLCISPKKDSATAATSNEKPVKEKSYPEFIKEAKLSYLQKTATTINAEDAVKMYEELVYEFANDLNVDITFTTYLGSGPTERQEKLRYKLISVCDMALAKLDLDHILAYFGCQKNAREDLIIRKKSSADSSKSNSMEQEVNVDNEESNGAAGSELLVSGGAKEFEKEATGDANAKDIEKQKSQMIDLLQKKCTALLDMSPVPEEKVEQSWKTLKKLTDPMTDTKTSQLALKYCRHRKLYGLVASKLMQEYENTNTKAALNNLKAAFKQLNWTHVVDRVDNSTLLVRFPPSYPPF